MTDTPKPPQLKEHERLCRTCRTVQHQSNFGLRLRGRAAKGKAPELRTDCKRCVADAQSKRVAAREQAEQFGADYGSHEWLKKPLVPGN